MTVSDQSQTQKNVFNVDREKILKQYKVWSEVPILVLGIVGLVLLIIGLLGKSNPTLNTVVNLIWVVFLIDFVLQFILAPRKIAYLKAKWISVIALALPGLRSFAILHPIRFLHTARIVRSINVMKILGSLNRGIRIVRSGLGQRGFGFVASFSLLVLFVSAAGVYGAENGATFGSYGEALWWAAMMMITNGVDPMPVTIEGRVMAFLLELYALGVLVYAIATLASMFIGRAAKTTSQDQRQVEDLRSEIRALRSEIQRLAGDPNSSKAELPDSSTGAIESEDRWQQTEDTEISAA